MSDQSATPNMQPVDDFPRELKERRKKENEGRPPTKNKIEDCKRLQEFHATKKYETSQVLHEKARTGLGRRHQSQERIRKIQRSSGLKRIKQSPVTENAQY
ncbi:hypothetical protein AVEN_228036-1 [Araneus ventricosus]|uniref:Uncharacterized protein n=1 Tax=Araneus ventricosus TaxID=182803 RepID=A0A4Y2T5S9_ARAVE|nr:hypothetical protein AVEN_228036-1 [Araneus ventricosus]